MGLILRCPKDSCCLWWYDFSSCLCLEHFPRILYLANPSFSFTPSVVMPELKLRMWNCIWSHSAAASLTSSLPSCIAPSPMPKRRPKILAEANRYRVCFCLCCFAKAFVHLWCSINHIWIMKSAKRLMNKFWLIPQDHPCPHLLSVFWKMCKMESFTMLSWWWGSRN